MKKKHKSKDPIKSILTKDITSILEKNPKKAFNYKQIAGILRMDDPATRTLINEILVELKDRNVLEEAQRGCFKMNVSNPYITGVVDLKGNGAAYVITDDLEEDVYVAPKFVRTAMHGDTVKVYIISNKKTGSTDGEIVEIIKRARTEFVGRVQLSARFAFLIPDSTKMNVDLFIPLEHLKGAKDGQKAIGRITEWPRGGKNPVGEIIDVLGEPGDNDVEMHAILAEFGLPYSFPRDVEILADKIPIEISQQEIEKRRDFRKITTFTIDPVDAKDFDDALSIRKLENGNWEIGVHIADVSHYVKEGSGIDKEAFNRATSIYLVDRVVPMLPEVLSNNVCSLRPNEEKLCFSAVFEMDDDARLIKEWFGRTIINSDRRFTYEEAQEVIETGKGDFQDEVLTLDRLAKILRADRFKIGSIDFHTIEVKFKMDEKGNPIGVYIKEQKDSNELVEDFMLLANRRVATFVGMKHTDNSDGKEKEESANGKQGKLNHKNIKDKNKDEQLTEIKLDPLRPFVYRIHPTPNEDKLRTFVQFVNKIGFKMTLKSNADASFALNKLIKEVEGKKEENMISQLAIRTMAKAIYTTKNIGHYGLGFKYYSHFTSPIRRYPDLMVHRLLAQYLEGKTVKAEGLEEQCKHSSDMEKLASEAERASIKYKQAQYLEERIGEAFDGVISGVTEWGLYVEIIENKCEGMIRIKDIEGDFYIYDEESYCLIGKKHGKKYQIGDKLKIEVKKVDLMKKQIDFMLAEED
ncbi:MAG: ribonuclease R [Bacteroidetes bacterium]|nr:ribonuclease R [Bacteroidota bacterium]HET6242933.1 ribonuclease R [Bacteroidia bacterium]